MRRLRTHLTYANVMSSIAAFMAISGVAWAASALPQNSVGTPQLKRNAVTSLKIKNGQVMGIDAKDNTFTGADINDGTLGKVPTAATAASAASATNAANAATATNASQLGGAGPATYNIGRAYGYINEEGTVEAGRSRNIVSVDRSSTGVYCVTLAPGIDLATVAPIVTLDKQDSATTIPPPSSEDDQGIVEWDSVNEDCPAGTLEFDSIIQSFAAGSLVGNTRNDQSFMVLIP
jgi:hypothetical protein